MTEIKFGVGYGSIAEKHIKLIKKYTLNLT